MSSKLQFAEGHDQAAKEAIAELRSDSSGVNWLLLSYEGPKSEKLVLLGKGSGGVPELHEKLSPEIIGYGLIRKKEQIDDSSTVKFAFFNWMGDNVPRMQKAKVSVHRGGVTIFVGQYHVDITASSLGELTDEVIEKDIAKASGTNVNVLTDEMAKTRVGSNPLPGQNWTPRSNTATKVASVPKTTNTPTVKFSDEEGLRAAIKGARADANRTHDWVVVGYEGKKGNTLVLLGTGSGGVEGALDYLQNDMVAYILYRTTEQIDESTTVKFVFIEWLGVDIDRMHKAHLSTHKGAIHGLFSPYHVDLLQVSDKGELSEKNILEKIKAASGTFNKVKSDS